MCLYISLTLYLAYAMEGAELQVIFIHTNDLP